MAGSILAVGVVLVVAFFVLRRRRMSDEAKLNTGVENPAYDMQLGDMSGSAPFSDDNMQPASSGMENPLYGDLIDA